MRKFDNTKNLTNAIKLIISSVEYLQVQVHNSAREDR